MYVWMLGLLLPRSDFCDPRDNATLHADPTNPHIDEVNLKSSSDQQGSRLTRHMSRIMR